MQVLLRRKKWQYIQQIKKHHKWYCFKNTWTLHPLKGFIIIRLSTKEHTKTHYIGKPLSEQDKNARLGAEVIIEFFLCWLTFAVKQMCRAYSARAQAIIIFIVMALAFFQRNIVASSLHVAALLFPVCAPSCHSVMQKLPKHMAISW